MEWVEIAAASVDEAREIALDRLGVTASELELEIVQEASSSLFGLRRTDARIRARVKPTKPPSKVGEARRDNDRRRSGRRGQKDSRQAKRGGGKTPAGDAGAPARTGGSKPAAEPATAKSSTAKSTTGGKPVTGKPTAAAPASQTADAGQGTRRRRRRGASSRPSSSEDVGRKSPSGGSASAPVTEAPGDSPAASSPKRIRRLADSRPGGNTDNTKNKDQDMSEELSLEEQGGLVVEFLDGVVESFGLTGKASITAVDEDWIDVSIEGDDLGLLIGPGGRTLSALAEVAKTALQRHVGDGRRGRVRVDVAGYREFRREALGQFAREQAAAVAGDGKSRVLEPMGSADRKIVHDAIIDVEGVSSTSEGDEPRRRVVLVPAD